MNTPQNQAISEQACIGCDFTKPVSDFHKSSSNKTGIKSRCKICCNIASRKYKKKYRQSEAGKAAIKAYRQSDEGKATMRAYDQSDRRKTDHRLADRRARSKAFRSESPIKRAAHKDVERAVNNGSIIKPNNCSVCAAIPSRLYGHHDDYSKPLGVRWLCGSCHVTWHMENGPGLNGDSAIGKPDHYQTINRNFQ